MDEETAMAEIQSLSDHFGYDLKSSLEHTISVEIANLNENLKERQKNLLDAYKSISIQPKIVISKIDIDVNKIVSELKFGWRDFRESALNPIGTLIECIWGNDNAKVKAKETAHKQINEDWTMAYEKIEISVSDISRKMYNILNGIVYKTDDDINTLNTMQKQLKHIMSNLNEYILSTKNQLNNN